MPQAKNGIKPYKLFEYPTLQTGQGEPSLGFRRDLPAEMTGALVKSVVETTPDHQTQMVTIQATLKSVADEVQADPTKFGLTIEDVTQLGGKVTKSFVANPLVGGRSSIFDICERVEYGFGIWGNGEDHYNAILNWLDPVIINDRRQFSIPILDYRNMINDPVTLNMRDILACDVAVPAVSASIGKCSIDYCADPGRGRAIAQGTLDVEDFMKRCYDEPPIYLNGSPVNDPQTLQDWLVLDSLRRAQILDAIYGSWDDGAGTGLLNFVDEFPARHPEVGDCNPDLLPQTIDLPTCPNVNATTDELKVYWMALGRIIEQELINTEGRVQGNGSSATVPDNYMVAMMRWDEAQCIQWLQSCMKFCNNVQLTHEVGSNPTDYYLAALADFQSRFKAGKWGCGQLILPTGRTIDIWCPPQWDQRMVQGRINLFRKGWTGGQNPNTYALRGIFTQWGKYIEYLRGRSPVTAQTIQPILNGTGFIKLPTQPAGDKIWVYSPPDLGFSNAPWLQTRFEGACLCANNYGYAVLPPLPPMAPPANCAPANFA